MPTVITKTIASKSLRIPLDLGRGIAEISRSTELAVVYTGLLNGLVDPRRDQRENRLPLKGNGLLEQCVYHRNFNLMH